MLPDRTEVADRPSGAILIVEDNEVNAMILRTMLRKRGFDPVVAADGVEGVALNERHRPQLILMDLQMPRLDGFAAAAEIFRTAGRASPTIIAVTANAAGDVLDACEAAGFAGVLAKPIDYNDLIATVRRLLGAC
jgi:CheY-like chemotaxis protein